MLLIGTQQGINSLYYDGFDPTFSVDPTSVLGYEVAMKAISSLPGGVSRVLDAQFNNYTKKSEEKAIYFCTASGRGYCNSMPLNYGSVLRDVYTGVILEQGGYTYGGKWDWLVLHEIGHLVDMCGIRVVYYWEPIWNLSTECSQIFDAKGELISTYANANEMEDFAEHFVYYVLGGTTFRERALSNVDLMDRYQFLRDNIFEGVEYEETTPPIEPPEWPPPPDIPPVSSNGVNWLPILALGTGLIIGVPLVYYMIKDHK